MPIKNFKMQCSSLCLTRLSTFVQLIFIHCPLACLNANAAMSATPQEVRSACIDLCHSKLAVSDSQAGGRQICP